jgi:uncharacterized damage-inducible protein DinB
MINKDYIQIFARYNQWQNQSLYRAAASLTEIQRQTDAGAFFGSIDATLRHILFVDRIWLSRFSDLPAPERDFLDWSAKIPSFSELSSARVAFDEAISDWSTQVTTEWLAGTIAWTAPKTGLARTMGAAKLVVHLFNHQTHHRGQVHALLTRFGATLDDTDLSLLPD